MKILVDELPKDPQACLFSHWNCERGAICQFSKTVCEDSTKCEYLKDDALFEAKLDKDFLDIFQNELL